MTKKELTAKVFSIIAEKLLESNETYISIHTYVNDGGIDLKFEYTSEEEAELINEMKLACRDQGIWFDSDWMTEEPIMNWNLDWYIRRNKSRSLMKTWLQYTMVLDQMELLK